jgi:hypothetical protein
MQQDTDTSFLRDREIGSVLEAYREKLPRKRKSNVQLRSVATTDGDAVAGESEDGGKENAGAADSAEQDDGTAAFKEQFPVPLKEPPAGLPSVASIAPESEPARATGGGGLFGAPATKKKTGGGLFEVRSRSPCSIAP